MMAILTTSIILICALLLAGCSYRVAEKTQHTATMVISLSAAFISSSAAANLLFTGADQDSETLIRILDNLAYYAAIPFIASALLDTAHRFEWSKAAWGRWLLALFALFELCRRMSYGNEYSQFMAITCVAVMAYSAVKLIGPARLITLLSTALLALSLLLFGKHSLLPAYSNTLAYALTFSGALLTLALSSTHLAPKESTTSA